MKNCCLERFIGGIEVWMEMWWSDCQIFISSQVCNHVVCLSEIEPCILFKGSPNGMFWTYFWGVYTTVMVWICWHYCQTCPTFFRTKTASWEHRELLKHLYPREYVKSVGRGGSMSTWHPESWESLFFWGVESDWPNWSPHKSFLGSEKQGTCCWYSQFWAGVINSAKMVQWSKKSEGMGPPNWDDSGQDISPSERGNLRDFQQTLLQPSIVVYGYTWLFGLKFTHGVSKDPNLPSGGAKPPENRAMLAPKGNSSEATHQFSGANCCYFQGPGWDWVLGLVVVLQPCGSPGLKSEHRSSRQLVSDAISALERTGSKARSLVLEFTGQWFLAFAVGFPFFRERDWRRDFWTKLFFIKFGHQFNFPIKWSSAFLKGFVSLIFLRGFYRRNDLRLRFPSGEVQPG